jgi:tetratricopeptide (TPR) repeat protein
VDKDTTSRILDREIFLLIALASVAICLFFVTRTVAAKDQQLERHIAAIWYSRGEGDLKAGKVEDAIESLRKATANARENRTYTLALASALAAGNHTAEAQQGLLRLRESDPEDAEINLYLARLAARRGELGDAIRYYQNALYGRWTGTEVDERRRQLRLELIRFLLDHHDPNRAISELLVLETDLPNSSRYRVETAKLFREAGDPDDALKNFAEAIRLAPHNVDALSGAAEISFQLGKYVAAQHYLKAALASNPESHALQQFFSLTKMVLGADPLAPGISNAERRRRLLSGVQQSRRRVETCLGRTADQTINAELQDLELKVIGMENELQSTRRLLDWDYVNSGIALVYKIEKTASANCGASSGLDQALLLIGSEHSGA